jgi:transposase
MASKHYGRYLTIRGGKGGKWVAIDREAARAAARCDGKWVLITNDDTIEAEDAARAYRGLMVIERCFRSLNRTQIKMGPMYHWLRRRIEAHVKICVLALLIQRVAEIACERPWAHIRRDLRRLKTTEFATENHHFFQRNELPSSAKKTLQALEVKAPASIMGIEKTV